MKSLFFFSIFFLSQLAYAGDENKNLFQKISEIISRINSGKVISPPQLSCNEEQRPAVKFISPLFNKCAVDICGPARKNISVWTTNANFSESIPLETLERVRKINPTFENVFKNAQKEKTKEQNELREFFLKTAKNLNQLPSSLEESMARDIFSPYVNVQVNASAPLEKRLTIIPKIPQNASAELASSINAYAEKMAAILPMDTRSLEFQNAFSDEDNFLPLAKMYFNKVMKQYKDNQKLVDTDLSFSFKTIETLLADKNMNKLNYDRAIMQIKYIDDTTSQFAKIKGLTRATCDAPDCQKVYQSFFNSSQLAKSMKKYESIVSSSQNRENALNRCKALVISKSLMAAEDKKARELFVKSREAILQNFLPRFSAHSREIMSKYLNEKLVVSGVDIRKKIAPYTDPIDYFKGSAAYYMESNLIAQETPDFAKWSKIMAIYKNNGEVNPYNDIFPCTGTAQVGWDSFLPLKNIDLTDSQLAGLKDLPKEDHIFVSDHSCENHLHGKHNTSHEIGHAINSLFKATPLSKESIALYRELRSCTNSYYPKAPLSHHNLSHPGDNLFAEEDISDLIAIASNPDDKKIYSCQLLRSNLAGDGYEDLSFIDIEDTHSTGLSRSIIEMVNKGIALPESCQNLIKEERPEMSLKKCL